jgi:hypothetical protein
VIKTVVRCAAIITDWFNAGCVVKYTIAPSIRSTPS